MPRPRDTRRGALGRPATPAASCGAPQAPGPLDAGRYLRLAAHGTAPTALRVRGDPSVGGAPRCLVASLGLPFPQRPPFAILRLGLRDGERWRGRLLASTLRRVESWIVWVRPRGQVADAVIEAKIKCR